MSANETIFRNPYLCKLSIDRPLTVFMDIGLAMEYSVERAVSCLCIVCCPYNLKIYTSLLTAMLPSFLSFFLGYVELHIDLGHGKKLGSSTRYLGVSVVNWDLEREVDLSSTSRNLSMRNHLSA